MPIIRLTIVIAIATGLCAAPNPVRFQEPLQISLPNGGGLLLSADLNGDGYTDLITYAIGGGLDVLLNNGHGGFDTPTLLAVPGTILAAVTGDFNGDGITDLAVSTGRVSAEEVLLFPGLGGGRFGTPSLIYSGQSAIALAADDFNRDGKLDIVIASSVVQIYLGNGDGTFHAAGQWSPAPDFVWALYVADFNADGNPDLLVVESNTYLYPTGGTIVFGDSQGNLITGPNVSEIGGSAPQLAVADVNGDGLPDLLIPWTPSDNAGVLVMLGNGDGTFHEESFHKTPVILIAVVAVDVNGDGAPDLAGLTYFNQSLVLMYGNGDGTFTAQGEYFAGIGPTAGYVGGLVTLFSPSGTQGFAVSGSLSPLSPSDWSITVLNLANGRLASPRLIQPGFYPLGMVTADFNGDGKLDLATAAPTGLAVMIGNGDGAFQKPVISAGFPGYFPFAAADVNQDGIPDVLVTSGSVPCETAVFLGNGDGTFRPLGTAPVLPVCGPTGVADLNGDGIPDVVWQPVPTGSFTVYLGKGDGTFGPPITNGYRLGNFDYVFADFNLDGKMDVAVGGDALLGNGDGTFQPPAPIAGMQLPAAAADLNGDGIPDLVGYNSTSSLTSLAIAFGNGDGTFGVPETFPLQGNEFNSGPTITIADWNGDGHLDIAAMPGGPYYTYFFLGDGTGHFTAQPTGILLSNTPFLAVGDFNGDGLPDVASASDSIWVLKNHSR